MIKFLSTRDNGRKILGLGLSDGNIEKLKEGRPIHFNVEDMKLININVNEVFIWAGTTEEKMREEFEQNGYLEGTVIIETPGSRH